MRALCSEKHFKEFCSVKKDYEPLMKMLKKRPFCSRMDLGFPLFDCF